MRDGRITITLPSMDGNTSFSRVHCGDSVDGMYGQAYLSLSLQDIAHLLHGGQLYSTVCGEYAVIIEYCGDENKND